MFEFTYEYSELNPPYIPSHFEDFLGSLIGKMIVSAVKYIDYTPEKYMKVYNQSNESEVFSLSSDPFVISFDSGHSLGINDYSRIASLILWDENDDDETRLENDKDVYPVSSNDERYSSPFFHKLVGLRVEGISIIRRKYASPRYDDLPCEVGLRFALSDGSDLVASHGLQDDSDNFALIPGDMILDEIRKELTETPIEPR